MPLCKGSALSVHRRELTVHQSVLVIKSPPSLRLSVTILKFSFQQGADVSCITDSSVHLVWGEERKLHVPSCMSMP